MNCYQKALEDDRPNPEIYVWLACTYFMLGLYEKALYYAKNGPNIELRNRLLFHLSQKFNDEEKILQYHRRLKDITEDQLSLASIHYLNSHYEEAIDILKKLLIDQR